MHKPLTAVVLGCGSRGNAYAQYALGYPNDLQIVGCAEPNAQRRTNFCKEYGISKEHEFCSWEDLLAVPKFADCVFVCTMDDMHVAPAVQALHQGYHVLLEKPMSPNREDCLRIVDASMATDRVLTVCHVLRYTPFFQTIKGVLEAGMVGDVMTLDQTENVAFWHQAHSFVRGNWRNSNTSSPMILQKSCHDLDIIHWLMNDRCVELSSYGSLGHFDAQHAPQGATLRCLDGCPHADECPYDVKKIYLTEKIGWPTDTISIDLSMEGRIKALQTGPYGRCVYHCDNNVVDHQVVNMLFAHGQVATFTMTGFTTDHGRQLKITGTKGQLVADMIANTVVVTDFLTQHATQVPVAVPPEMDGVGHGGGDLAIVRDFLANIQGDSGSHNLSTAEESLQSHLMCFAAEKSRVEHTTQRL